MKGHVLLPEQTMDTYPGITGVLNGAAFYVKGLIAVLGSFPTMVQSE